MSLFASWARKSIGIGVVIVGIDQHVKWRVTDLVGPTAAVRERWLVGDWIGLSYAENTGIAFGLLRGWPVWLLLVVGFVIVGLLGAFVRANASSGWVVIGAGLIGGGAIGNMIDRMALGHVRDFFAIGPWPSFNVADAAISCGVGVTAIGLVLLERAEAHAQNGDRSLTRTGRAETMDVPE